MAFVYSLDEVDVDVCMVDVAVTESGVASFGGVGGKLNIGCEDELECWCSDLVNGSSLPALAPFPPLPPPPPPLPPPLPEPPPPPVPLKAEHQLLLKLLLCGDCLLSEDDTEL